MTREKTFRDQVIEKFIAGLGKPEVSTVESGDLYRWSLHRGPRHITMYVTIDSPEHTSVAHVILSDGARFQADPLVTITVLTIEEAEALLQRVLRQWKSFGEPGDK